MLIRLITSLIIIVVNALAGAVTCSKHKCATKHRSRPLERPTIKDGFVIGREIVDIADVSATPTLGDAVKLKFEDLLCHLYGIGRTGCGKTTLLMLLIDAFVACKQTFVLIDARGDQTPRVLSRLAGFADAAYWRKRLTIIDLPSSWSSPFNFFAALGDPYGIAGAIFDAIEERTPGGLGVQNSETIRSGLLALAFGRGKWTLLHLEPLLTNGAFRKVVLADCADPLVLSFWDRYEKLSPDQQANWTGAVLNKLAPWLAVPQLRRMVGQKDCLPFRRMIDTPGHIMIVKLGISELHSAAGLIGSMVASAIIHAAMSRATDTAEGTRNPVYVLADEVENYVCPPFHVVLQEGRRMGIGIAPFHQNLSQLKTVTTDLTLNNAKTLFLFATGARDAGQLAREVGGDEAWDARTILTRQQTGQAYLLRRGELPKRVQIDCVPDPKVAPDAIEAIRDGAFAEFARPAADVDAEIAAEFAGIRQMRVTVPAAGEPAFTDEEPTFQVRPMQTKTGRRRKEAKE